MSRRSPFHIIDTDPRRRADVARELSSQHLCAEVYVSLAAFCDEMPDSGAVLAFDDPSSPPDGLLRDAMTLTLNVLPIALYAEHPSPAQIVRALRNGVLDYFQLPFDGPAIRTSLDRLITEGERSAALMRQRFMAHAFLDRLTRRERDVLSLLASGCSNKQMARRLGISPRTVEIHRGHLMLKLNARNVAEAVKIALEANLDLEWQISEH